MKVISNQRGQGLIEYLILVALIAVGSIVLLRSVGQNLNARYADVVHALGGQVEGSRKASSVSENMYRKRDLRDFAQGVVQKDDGGSK